MLSGKKEITAKNKKGKNAHKKRTGIRRMEERKFGRQSGGVFKCLVYNGAVSLTLIDGGTFCVEGIKTHALTGVSAEAFASALLFAAFAGAGLLCNACAWVLTRAGFSTVIGLFAAAGVAAIVLTLYLLKLPAD